jgi:aspartyl-tRNA(Asn)/glutamyl-tRNA(Gln) amidotransferase subunit A
VARAGVLTDLTLAEASDQVRERVVSPIELTEAFLERISRLDETVKAFVTVLPEQARADAERAEVELAAGRWRGPLHGMPVAVKDLVATAGVPTSAGSRILDGWVPERDATVVRRLRDAGVVLLGKVTTHEFAMDVYTPPTRNPWSVDRIPGGSSGGSAAALAARLCLASIGTDTGGSIRIPAALCGVVGLKPTYGRVSRAGVVPFSWSLDHVGPLARTARDAGLVLEAIAGYDPDDPSSARAAVDEYARDVDAGIDGIRIGVPSEFFFDRVTPEAEQAARSAVETLCSLGAEAESVSLPSMKLTTAVGDAISFPEASLYHRRWLRERAADYSPRTRANLELGELFLATDYLQAQRLRTVIADELAEALRGVDVVAAPTTPIAAVRADATSITFGPGDEESPLYTYCRLTYPANVTGFPAASTPCGFTDDGLPLGLQLVARPFDEALLLRVAHAYEQATGWHGSQPAATRQA